MVDSREFLKAVLDSITDHVVVIEPTGRIRYVNQAWLDFGQENEGVPCSYEEGGNYLQVCDRAAASGDEISLEAVTGIREVIRGERKVFYLEYPCHSPDEPRWFMMRVTFFELAGEHYYLISHQNITERKLAEEKVMRQSRVDGLTGVSNRRHFDEFLAREWRRCARLQLPLSLAIIDIDRFKELNDTHGHQGGDESLRQVSAVLAQAARRPGDQCARFGGDEFCLLFPGTGLEPAQGIISGLLDRIRELRIPCEGGATFSVTASIGLVTMWPDAGSDETWILGQADTLLYAAKEDGRNRIRSREEAPRETG